MIKKNKQSEYDNKMQFDKAILFIILFSFLTIGGLWYYQSNIYNKQILKDKKTEKLNKEVERLRDEIKKIENSKK